MALRIIDQALVRELLPMGKCIELMQDAMLATSRGSTIQPPRWIVGLPDNRGFGLMPGAMTNPACFGAKLTAVYPDNGAKGLQSHQGTIVLFEAENGAPVAIVHGGEVTAVRTAAASGLATRILAVPDADDLAILGYGEQALQHLRAMAAVRPLKRVRIWGRSSARAQLFAQAASSITSLPVEVCDTVEAAVNDASLICTVTAAVEPILERKWVASGAHINVVGSSIATAREIDSELVAASRFFVDYRPSTLLQGGELLAAIREGQVSKDHICAEIGEVLAELKAGRCSEAEITIYKSLGIPAEDLVCAHYLHQTAVELDRGVAIAF